MITLLRFRKLEEALQIAGYAGDSDWAEQLLPARTPDQFAHVAIYVIVNSGMKFRVAQGIYERCINALAKNHPIAGVFKHPGKAKAIEYVWAERFELYDAFQDATDKLAFCTTLPWIGPVTSYHLAKDLGVDVAKPDVHLARLARRDRISVQTLCRRLARQTGYRIATIDTMLWRACATGILNSRQYELDGWRKAFLGRPLEQH